jgi:hypothetical protein
VLIIVTYTPIFQAVLDAIGFYQENRDHDESVYHKMERAHALNDEGMSPKLTATTRYEDELDHSEPLPSSRVPDYKV